MAPVTTTDKNVAFSRGRSRERIHEEIGDLETFERVLAFAIDEEKKSCDFYLGLAKSMRHQWMSRAFARLARENRRQRERLLRMRLGPCPPPIFEKAPPSKLTDYDRAALLLAQDFDAREALAVAIGAKTAAQRLYMDLAAKTKNIDLKILFRAAAAEEAKHKAAFEAEYAARVPKREPGDH
jgi:rubrerythrin